MRKVGWLDYRLGLGAGIRFQGRAFVAYHFGKILLCFGVLAAKQDSNFEIAEHCFTLVLTINHVKVSQRLRQHHYTDMAFAQLTQGLGYLEFAKGCKFIQAKQNHLRMLFWPRRKILHRLRRDNAQQVAVDF